MAYIPKSKYQFLQASGHEYFYPKTKTPYIGPYILTSEGAFIGKNINQKNKERLVPQSLKGKKQDNIFFTSKTNEYYRLKPNTSKFIQKTLPIIATKVKPTEKDYERGYYTRYFCKRNNAENVRTAKKGELTYLDGKEYMGYYHIHLGKPMEGLYHENKSHQNLLFVDKNTLYKKDLNIEQTYYTHGPYNDLNRTNNLNYTPSQLTQKQTTNILLQPTNTPPTEEGGY